MKVLLVWLPILTPIAVAVLGWWQWRLSGRATSRQAAAEVQANSRKRDVEMLAWGELVITNLAQIEAAVEAPQPGDDLRWRTLMADASALVDRGRLFFPNVAFNEGDDHPDGKGETTRGYRVSILDEVVRAYLLAKFALAKQPFNPSDLQSKARGARRRFVDKLQIEMGESLRKSGVERIGVSIPKNPNGW